MAYIQERPRKTGGITYQVRWHEGGGRAGTDETERFGDPESAEKFRLLVNAHDQHWPPGWVRGEGFVEQPATPGDMLFGQWGERYISRLVGIDERTREDYRRDLNLHFSLLQHVEHSGSVVPATICNLIADDIQDWVRAEEKGEQDPDNPEKWLRRKADPKSIRNRHGLLFCIVQAAVEAEPQLRTKNCCKGTKLPRLDDHTEDEMTFLERDEFVRVAAEIRDEGARDLAEWLVGTGMRWGEATALQVQDLNLRGATPTASIHRAWKRAEKGSEKSFFIGPPKTKRARRTIALAPAQVDMLRRLVAGQPPEAYVFRTATGKHWRHSNFYHRKWQPAVKTAVEKGLPKRPRIHDLRHTHVAWLIAANIPLPAIQVRLGHESISTTVDRYGHLVRALDGEVSAAVQAALTSVPTQVRPRLRRVAGG